MASRITLRGLGCDEHQDKGNQSAKGPVRKLDICIGEGYHQLTQMYLVLVS